MLTQIKASRIDWGVPLSWARAYPQWEECVRDFCRKARAEGLTQIVVTPREHEVDLTALPLGTKWEDAA